MDVAIVGAGLVGSLLASGLNKRGIKVDVYERRPDQRKSDIPAGRSINLALSDRGWKALDEVGIGDRIRELSIPMHGRQIHHEDGNMSFQPYGEDGQSIFSVSRASLNMELVNHAETGNDINFYFDKWCTGVDLEKGQLIFDKGKASGSKNQTYDLIFGADGAFSVVRDSMEITDRFDYSQTFLEHGYKELTIPPGKDGSWMLEKNALHIWPRKQFMLIALPNLDGSFTCTLFLAFEGEISFSKINDETVLNAFFKKYFSDVLPLMTTLNDDFFNNQTSSLVTIRCNPWVHENRTVLIGDAAHAIIPFYGQGMNAGFEDYSVLVNLIDKYDSLENVDWHKVLEQYQDDRKPNGDAISELAHRNFIEMRDLVGDTKFLLRKQIEKKVHAYFPDRFSPLYSLVTFSHTPYAEALRIGNEQDKIMDEVMKIDSLSNEMDDEKLKLAVSKIIENS